MNCRVTKRSSHTVLDRMNLRAPVWRHFWRNKGIVLSPCRVVIRHGTKQDIQSSVKRRLQRCPWMPCVLSVGSQTRRMLGMRRLEIQRGAQGYRSALDEAVINRVCYRLGLDPMGKLRSFMETFSLGIHLSSAALLTRPPSDMDKGVANRLGAIQNRLDQMQDFELLHHC